MKKINLILSALACLVAMAWTACTDEVEYTPTVPTDGVSGVYFPDGQASSYTLTEDTTAFSFFICRTDTVGEKVVDLIVETDSAAATQLTIPTSVVFADKDSVAEIVVTYDPAKLVRGESYSFSVSVAQADAMNYLNTAYEAKASFPQLADWQPVGKATYHDTFIFYDPYEVDLEQDMVNPNKYRLHLPYVPGYENVDREGYTEGSYDPSVMDEYLYFMVLKPGSTLFGVDITKEGLVYFDVYNTGCIHPSYGFVLNLISPAAFTSFTNESALAKNYVTAWQDNGEPAQIQLAPWYYMMEVGGFNYSTSDGMITITFPGVVLGDFSIGVEYAGQYTDASGENTRAVAKVSFGKDVESAKVAMAKTDDPNAVYGAMLEGTIETVELADSGYVSFPLDKSGFYTIVAASYGDGKEQEVTYTTFEYTGGGAVWESMGMGAFTDGAIGPMFFAQDEQGTPFYDTYEVEIQRNIETEGLYRMVNPFAIFSNYLISDNNVYVEFNAQDPQCVYVPLQTTGLSLGQYGEIPIYSYAAYYLDNGKDIELLKEMGVGGVMDGNVITFYPSTEDAISGICIVVNNNIYESGYPSVITLPTAEAAAAKSVKTIRKSGNATLKNNVNLKKQNYFHKLHFENNPVVNK